MNRLVLIGLASAVFGLSACDEPAQAPRVDTYQPAEPALEATPAEDEAAPVVEETAPITPPNEALPAESRTSEESVSPDSETLFY